MRPAHRAAAVAVVPLAALAVVVAIGAVRSPDTGPSADTFVFAGRGFGHGVGMSQYGAYGRARAGWSAGRILAHYYPGTALRSAPGRPVRVLLATERPRLTVGASTPWRVVGRDRTGARRQLPLAAGRAVALLAQGADRVAVRTGDGRTIPFAGRLRLESTEAGGVLSWGDRHPEPARRHRGALHIRTRTGGLEVINAVGLEDYLRGVVPAEMSPAWDRDGHEALRAQAVAARSYALAARRPGHDFDLHADTRSQAYGGVAAEDERTDRAVRATRGMVLTHGGGIIMAHYFSTSGGRTENVEVAWPGSTARPYLVSVDDQFDRISPYHVWARPPRFGAARLGELLGVGDPVARVRVLDRGASPRVTRVRITTTKGQVAVLSGADVRARLGLRDTWFTVAGGAS